MRPRRRTILALSLAGAAAGLALVAGGTSAQQPAAAPAASAAQVGDLVQRFYDQTKTLEARFEQRYVNKVYNRTDVSRGRVKFRRPGRMRFDYDQPNGKVVVSNGSRVLVYEPGESGGAGQYFEQAMTDSELPAALSFLTGTRRLAADFRFRLLDARRYGNPSGYVLELRPRRRSPHYDRVIFHVDGASATRGVVQRVFIVDHANNRNQFDFVGQRINRTVADSVFEWRPPTNARRIQP